MRKHLVGKRPGTILWAIALLPVLMLAVPCLFPVFMPMALADPLPFDNSAFAEVNGVSSHYRTYRPRDERVQGKLLLVHGLGGSTFSFDASAPLITEKGYYVVSVDLPGFGFSGRDPAYDHSQQNRAADVWLLLQVIDQNLPQKAAAMPWHLAGHSMGGGTVAAMAMQEPSRAQTLILVDAALFDAPNSGGFLAFPPLGRWAMTALEHFLITENRVKSLLTSAYGRDPSQAEIEGYLAPLRLPGTARSWLNLARKSKNEDPTRLKGLAVPIFAIWGSRDTWVPLEALDKVRVLRPDLTARIIEGAAHCPMETHPDVFSAAVLAWLSDNPEAGS